MASIEKRTSKDGKVRHRARVRLKGYPPQYATFSRKSDAENWIQDTESAIRNGRYFKSSEAKRHTLSDLITRYLTWVPGLKMQVVSSDGQNVEPVGVDEFRFGVAETYSHSN